MTDKAKGVLCYIFGWLGNIANSIFEKTING